MHFGYEQKAWKLFRFFVVTNSYWILQIYLWQTFPTDPHAYLVRIQADTPSSQGCEGAALARIWSTFQNALPVLLATNSLLTAIDGGDLMRLFYPALSFTAYPNSVWVTFTYSPQPLKFPSSHPSVMSSNFRFSI